MDSNRILVGLLGVQLSLIGGIMRLATESEPTTGTTWELLMFAGVLVTIGGFVIGTDPA